MRTLYIDTETFCETPIAHGTYRYAEHAEVMLVPWAWNDEAVTCWDLTTGEADLANVQELIDAADEIVVHNSMFDRTVLAANGVAIPVEKIVDTMVQALSHSLPGGLDKLCDILGVPTDKAKLKSGNRLIHLFCKPQPANRKVARATRLTHPAEWAEFKDYTAMDVVSMREVAKRLPKWNYPRAAERELWGLDQRINDRGMLVDTKLAEAALRAVDRSKKVLAKRASDLSDGAVAAATQRAKVLEFLSVGYGVNPEDLKGATVEKLLESDDLHPDVRDMLGIRLQASATAPAKYKALLRGVSADGRLRGTLQFCGAARTGRDAGRLFQGQNLPRPVLKAEDIDLGIEALKHDAEDLLYDNVMELCGSAVRGSIIAPPKRKLVVADLSNIEGRMAAWIAGEAWKLDAFRAYDTFILDEKGARIPDGKSDFLREGHDLYKITAGSILHKPPEEVTKDERQVSGKVPELACGYQGALGAFKTMGALYGVDLPDETVLSIVKAWRAAHPNIRNFWYGIEEACAGAVRYPGQVFRRRDIAVQRDGAWLRIRLPSGRYLCYPGVELDDLGKLSYEGVNQYSRKWERLKTYGGKLFENIVQAAARDVFFAGVKRAEAAGYEIISRVHDELVTETPDDPVYSAEGLSALMAANDDWNEGLPLAAAGFSCVRYRKDG